MEAAVDKLLTNGKQSVPIPGQAVFTTALAIVSDDPRAKVPLERAAAAGWGTIVVCSNSSDKLAALRDASHALIDFEEVCERG